MNSERLYQIEVNNIKRIKFFKVILGIVFSLNLIACENNSDNENIETGPSKPIEHAEPRFSSINSESFKGNVFHVLTLKDGQYAFASISQKEFLSEDGSIERSGVVAVLKKENDFWKTQRYVKVNSPILNNKGSVSVVYGMALTPDESILAVTMDKKVALLNVNTLLKGDVTPSYVDLDTGYLEKTGAIAVVAAKDNKHFFIANEYGRFEGHAGIGDVAIISASINGVGIIQGQRLGYIKTGQNSIASLNISPDGKTLYIPNQVASKSVNETFTGTNNPLLSKLCVNTNYSGSLSIVDVDTVISLADQNPGDGKRVIEKVILANVASGCNAVRVAPSLDGKTVWVTARGSANIRENLIHAYDAELLRSNPENAYLYSLKSNGESPIGIASFENDKYIAVSNSNRFEIKDDEGVLLPANISIFDISNRKNPKLVKILESGDFPRDISVSYDSKNIYVANWNSGNFQEITQNK